MSRTDLQPNGLHPEENGRAMGRVVMCGDPRPNFVTWSPCGRRGGVEQTFNVVR